jgi:hypothetical protein
MICIHASFFIDKEFPAENYVCSKKIYNYAA